MSQAAISAYKGLERSIGAGPNGTDVETGAAFFGSIGIENASLGKGDIGSHDVQQLPLPIFNLVRVLVRLVEKRVRSDVERLGRFF